MKMRLPEAYYQDSDPDGVDPIDVGTVLAIIVACLYLLGWVFLAPV